MDGDWLSTQSLCTISSIVLQFVSMSYVFSVVVETSQAHKMLLEVNTDEARVVFSRRSKGKLTPKSLEILGVMLSIETNVVLLFVGNVKSLLDQNFTLLVYFNMSLLRKKRD